MSALTIKKKYTLSPGVFLMGTTVYLEWLLHFWVTETFQWGRFAALTAFALGFGGLLAFLVSWIPGAAAGKRTAVAVSAALGAVWLLEYFLSDAYQVFMPPVTVFNGAGGVARDYLGLVLSLLARNIWRLALVMLPALAYGLLGRGKKTGLPGRGLFAAVAVAGYLLGLGAAFGLTRDYGCFQGAYTFDSTVRCYGLQMGFVLEARYGSGSVQEPEFAEPLPVPTTQPARLETGETEPEQTEPVYPEQVIAGLDFGELAETEKNSAIASIHTYVDSLTPARQNAYTGLFAGKNLILITAEALTREVIDPELTPTLYRLATQGVQFTDYYQPGWGASTISGEFSNLIGLVPTNGGGCMKEVKQQNFFLTMGHQLQKLGYWSAAYHNNDKGFYDRDETHTLLGYDRFIALYGGLENVQAVWPESDLEMMVETVPQYLNQEHFSVYYMTVSGHSVYSRSANAMATKNYDQVADLPYSEPVKCYLAANLELEAALTYLVEQLEAAGIADDTVIVISPDHFPYGLEESSTWGNGVNHLAELYGVEDYNHIVRDHSTLILWSGCLEGQNITVDEPTYSLDILPTLLNLFGLEYDSRLLVGRDVFSEEMPLVLWPDFSWKTQRGSYDAQAGTFESSDGQPEDPEYLDYIRTLVMNKISYCRYVLDRDYFNYVAAALEPVTP